MHFNTSSSAHMLFSSLHVSISLIFIWSGVAVWHSQYVERINLFVCRYRNSLASKTHLYTISSKAYFINVTYLSMMQSWDPPSPTLSPICPINVHFASMRNLLAKTEENHTILTVRLDLIIHLSLVLDPDQISLETPPGSKSSWIHQGKSSRLGLSRDLSHDVSLISRRCLVCVMVFHSESMATIVTTPRFHDSNIAVHGCARTWIRDDDTPCLFTAQYIRRHKPGCQ